MPVRLRLRRTGAKNKACFRIVAADGRCPRDGRFIERLGYYDPRHQDEQINLERAEYWIQNGAQPSETVAGIIRRAKDPKAKTTEANLPESTELTEINKEQEEASSLVEEPVPSQPLESKDAPSETILSENVSKKVPEVKKESLSSIEKEQADETEVSKLGNQSGTESVSEDHSEDSSREDLKENKIEKDGTSEEGSEKIEKNEPTLEEKSSKK